MATTTITIPDSVLPRVLDAYAARRGYDPAGGQTKAQFLKAGIIAELKDIVRSYEAGQAGITAQQTAATKADAEISIT